MSTLLNRNLLFSLLSILTIVYTQAKTSGLEGAKDRGEVDTTSAVTVTFQEGVGGYAGTVDTFIKEASPDFVYGNFDSLEWDTDDPLGSGLNKVAVIRFENLFGEGGGQIPPGAAIHSATLYYGVYNLGNPAQVYEAAIDWRETDTWNSFGGDPGIQGDEIGTYVAEAAGASLGLQSLNVTASLSSWSNDPSANHGWVFMATGTDGVDFRSSEYASQAERPALVVTYLDSPENQPPNPPTLVYPPDGSVTVLNSPTLEVTVSDPELDEMDVTFYGRETGDPPGSDFTLIALPDTQFYSESFPHIFTAQTQWIVDQKDALNIAYVAHEGDIVQTETNIPEWENADAAMDLLDLGDVRYGVTPGNHDIPSDNYNLYFGVSRFENKPYYGGHLGDDNDNNYATFNAGGMDFIVINLRYAPGTTELDWADGLLKNYPNHRGIIVTHSLLYPDNSWTDPTAFTALKDNPNLFLMLCGHRHTPTDGAAQRTEIGDYGNTIYVLMADYQEYPYGGSGYLRVMTFSPAEGVIHVRTYSPWMDVYLSDVENAFDLAYEMPGSFQALGTVSGVASGSHGLLVWPELVADQAYEWFVTVSDPNQWTTGPIWGFTTGPGELESIYLPVVNR